MIQNFISPCCFNFKRTFQSKIYTIVIELVLSCIPNGWRHKAHNWTSNLKQIRSLFNTKPRNSFDPSTSLSVDRMRSLLKGLQIPRFWSFDYNKYCHKPHEIFLPDNDRISSTFYNKLKSLYIIFKVILPDATHQKLFYSSAANNLQAT